MIDTERRDWIVGFGAARRYQEREGDLLVPYSHTEAGYPLGRWISQQRREYGAKKMPGARARRLEGIGMVWDAGDHTWQENLAAARVYYEMHGTLAAPRSATALDRPIGQWLSNLRRPGALDDHPGRAVALAAIDPDWRPDWPTEWQRSYARVRDCVAGGATLAELPPGVTAHGEDVGAWLEMQRQHVVWHGLSDGQRERLAALGVEPLPEPVEIPAVEAAPEALSGAFGRGVRALRQYRDREGAVTVSRAHVETLDGGTEVKLGVWLANTKARRAKLSPEQVAALAALELV
ncbi:helicase associated domain-containing protein [Streptomyces sp. SL13]|uniref:Helicase associated domain-containing protein n=1 Tax=Streptantibioticus silvisoli TaxID=2705255 RepID=A0AA90H4H9_9ACTN|nr:helicase associated domain-containing protein [Streptantibioticus silvisoli]MDI5973968.1 helicase associated domain-containing protein [Streptantibioticus silvisoli]